MLSLLLVAGAASGEFLTPIKSHHHQESLNLKESSVGHQTLGQTLARRPDEPVQDIPLDLSLSSFASGPSTPGRPLISVRRGLDNFPNSGNIMMPQTSFPSASQFGGQSVIAFAPPSAQNQVPGSSGQSVHPVHLDPRQQSGGFPNQVPGPSGPSVHLYPRQQSGGFPNQGPGFHGQRDPRQVLLGQESARAPRKTNGNRTLNQTLGRSGTDDSRSSTVTSGNNGSTGGFGYPSGYQESDTVEDVREITDFFGSSLTSGAK